MQAIIDKVTEQMNFITEKDMAAIMSETGGKADFRILARTGCGRKVINSSEYESFPAEVESKGDYIRDFAVGFFTNGIEDQSWKFFCDKWL